jgi:DNA-binding response OmpR family regulator
MARAPQDFLRYFELSAPTTSSQTAPDAERSGPARNRIRILVVDDDTEILDMLERALPTFGYSPVCASDAAAALEELERAHFDIVMLDWMLPGMDGIELLGRIREREDAPPVVMVSAKSRKDAVLKAIQSGAAYYAVKPVQLGNLVLKMNAIVGRTPDEETPGFARNERPRRGLRICAGTATVLQDLSMTGCALRTTFPVPEGHLLFVDLEETFRKLNLPGGHCVPVRVANQRGAGRRWQLGVQFLDIAKEAATSLQQFCRSRGSLAAASTGTVTQRTQPQSPQAKDPAAWPTILVAEGDEESRNAIVRWLKEDRIDAHPIPDAATLRQLLAKQPNPDAILYDEELPGGDDELLRSLCEGLEGPPVMVLSREHLTDGALAALGSGAADCAALPAEKDSILFKVHNLVGSEVSRRRSSPRKPVSDAALIPFLITHLEAHKMSLEATFPLPEKTVLTLLSDDLVEQVDAERGRKFNVRVNSCSGSGNAWQLNADILNVPPQLAQQFQRLGR